MPDANTAFEIIKGFDELGVPAILTVMLLFVGYGYYNKDRQIPLLRQYYEKQIAAMRKDYEDKLAKERQTGIDEMRTSLERESKALQTISEFTKVGERLLGKIDAGERQDV